MVPAKEHNCHSGSALSTVKECFPKMQKEWSKNVFLGGIAPWPPFFSSVGRNGTPMRFSCIRPLPSKIPRCAPSYQANAILEQMSLFHICFASTQAARQANWRLYPRIALNRKELPWVSKNLGCDIKQTAELDRGGIDIEVELRAGSIYMQHTICQNSPV